MSFESISPNMNLPIPSVGATQGPTWASDINACLSLVDTHDHSSGSGVQVTPAGLNINADLSLNSNNLVLARSLRMQSQSTAIIGASDLGAVYNLLGELYYKDGLGNNVQITSGGSVAGTPGSIANLVSPASASYVALNSTFVWQSDANTPANMDAASYIFRNLVANSFGLTLNPPSAMGANYSLTLPSIPGSTSFLTIDTGGNISGSVSTNQGIVTNNLANNSVTRAKIEVAEQMPTGSMLIFPTTTIPTGWLFCDGTAVSRTTYADLFAVLGGTFGLGDGSTTFNLPDFRGRFLRGWDSTAGRDPDSASRTAMNGGGNTGNNIGSVQSDQVGPHTHSYDVRITNVPNGNSAPPQKTDGAFGSTVTLNTNSNATSETRPINAYVNYIIKY